MPLTSLGLGMRADHLRAPAGSSPDSAWFTPDSERIGVAARDHARAEVVAVVELAARLVERSCPFAAGSCHM